MLSNSKRLIAALALIVALPVLAHAQTSRIEGMAIQGDYVKDYTSIYQWPAQVSNVGNLIYGEFGNSNFPNGTYDRAVGAVLGNLWDGRFGTWGVHLRENTPNLGQGDVSSQPHAGLAGFDPNNHSNQSFDLQWGRKFGTTSFGLALNRSFYREEISLPGVTTTLEFDDPTAGDPNLARNIWGFGGGVAFEMSPQSMFEVAVLYQNRTFEASFDDGTVPGTTRAEDDGSTAYILAARMMWQWTSNVVVTPLFKWYNYDLGVTNLVGGTTTSFDNTMSGWQIGAAGNWSLGANDLFVLGVTFANNRIEQQYDVFGLGAASGLSDTLDITETIYPQIFAALETHVNSWLTLRFGANKGVFQTVKLEEQGAGTGPGQVTDEITFSDFEMMLGAGVKVGTLQFDAVVADDFFQNLGWLGSGNSHSGGYFPKVTATYGF